VSDHPAKTPRGPAVSRRGFLAGVGAGAALTVVGRCDAPAEIVRDAAIEGRTTHAIRLRVDGTTWRLNVESGETLLDVLRNRLDLTGPKLVCDRASCGACTVLADGVPIYSCTRLAVDCEGVEITTVESMTDDGALDPIQQAIVDHDATQCGFCTPGMAVTLKALLERNPDPTEEEVRDALSGNLCKCGTYPKLFRAALDAARMRRERR
jgi:aerobic-type carbon monoxide dehydrogenase small subunit (CoxS/CutS family)